MSAETLSAISGALSQTLAPQLTRMWNRSGVLASMLPVVYGGSQGNGKNVAWGVEMDGASAAAFAEGSDVGGGELDFDTAVLASLNWGQYRAAFQISNLELNAAAASQMSPTALEDIFGERVLGKSAKLLDKINADLFTGTGLDGSSNPNIVGLNTALAATGSYAGISQGTYSIWAGNVSGNGGTARPLSMSLLAQLENLGFIASGMQVGCLLTSAGVRAKYEGLFESVRRTIDDGSAMVKSYEGSTKDLFWRGAPVFRDRQNPTSTLYMLDPNEVELAVLPFTNSKDGVMTIDKPAPSGNGKEFSQTQIPLHIYPLGRTGSGIKFVVEIYCQLKVKRRNAHAMLQDISET